MLKSLQRLNFFIITHDFLNVVFSEYQGTTLIWRISSASFSTLSSLYDFARLSASSWGKECYHYTKRHQRPESKSWFDILRCKKLWSTQEIPVMIFICIDLITYICNSLWNENIFKKWKIMTISFTCCCNLVSFLSTELSSDSILSVSAKLFSSLQKFKW